MDSIIETFRPFPKTPRLCREAVITEKIDGTNAQVFVWDVREGMETPGEPSHLTQGIPFVWSDGITSIAAGSRTRWITPGKNTDNYGFAGWVQANGAELAKLGHGRHFGEWWGQGIQRNYGVDTKRFSLFNADRWFPYAVAENAEEWGAEAHGLSKGVIDAEGLRVTCCRVVPIIWRGTFDTTDTRNAIEILKSHGSFAAPGFKNPEGIMVYHTAAKQLFKQLIENDSEPKGETLIVPGDAHALPHFGQPKPQIVHFSKGPTDA